jgi:hypothetical protein
MQHDASKVALMNQVPHKIPTLPTYYQGEQQRLRNPTYGRTRLERGKLVPTHSKQSEMPVHQNGKTILSDAHRPTRRIRSWINEDTGLLKPDGSGNQRFCHKCKGQNHCHSKPSSVTQINQKEIFILGSPLVRHLKVFS